jgi:hypothetical protein
MLATSLTSATNQNGKAPSSAGIAIDADDIGGTVSSANGPEAGVWVIAETKDLPTGFIKTVVTDEQGRFVIPDLPMATYQVFVRGYGLIDSVRVPAMPGQHLSLKAVVAPDGRAAAQYYPAGSWFSLIEIPKGPLSDQEVVSAAKECMQCHQNGDRTTRELTRNGESPGQSSLEAWDRRVQRIPLMAEIFRRLGPQRRMFADWTDRIAAGAYPPSPRRPAGIERNVVTTQWDWAWPTGTRSDSIATNEDNPRLNANGPVYGVYTTGGKLAWMNPQNHTIGAVDVDAPGLRSVAMDAQGRVWFTSQRPSSTPEPVFCKSQENKFVKNFPLPSRGKQLIMYDPKTTKVEKILTCQAVDHNHFGNEQDRPLYFGQENALGWVNTATWDKTHDGEAAQGWCPAVLDTNGDGKITEWTEPTEPIDPRKDHRINFGCYSVAVSPVDGSLWCTGIDHDDNKLVRIERGNNPPASCKAEVYLPPTQKTPFFKSGGVTVDHDGVAWIGWRGSDQVTGFDRRKCRETNGPTATGTHCPEGWSVYQSTRPMWKGTGFPSQAEMMYLTHVDRHNALGLGADVVVSGVGNSNALQVLVTKTGRFLDLVVPYPMGFFSRSSQGRIDDPASGWKGRGLWSNTSSTAPQHGELGRGAMPRAVKFQVRPNPLAK